MKDPYRLAGEREKPLPKPIISKWSKFREWIRNHVDGGLIIGIIGALIVLFFIVIALINLITAIIDRNDPLYCEVIKSSNNFNVERHSVGDVFDETIGFFPTRSEAEKFISTSEMCKK